MLVLGLLLVGAAVAFGVDVFVQNTAPQSIVLFGQTYTARSGVIVLIAAACGVVAFLGLCALLGGSVGSSRRRREHRAALRERDALAAQMEATRAEQQPGAYMTTTAPAAMTTSRSVAEDARATESPVQRRVVRLDDAHAVAGQEEERLPSTPGPS